MPVVAIVGAPGIGKSTLLQQLSAATDSPMLCEGEAGAIPPWVFESVRSRTDTLARWKYYIDRYERMLYRAQQISQLGMLVFVDGSALTGRATMELDPAELHAEIEALIARLDAYAPDQTLVLYASREYLRTKLAERGRPTEQNAAALERSLAVQEHCLRLASSVPNAHVLDRTNLDFLRHEDLQGIVARMTSWLEHE